jgi:hypothetical protein
MNPSRMVSAVVLGGGGGGGGGGPGGGGLPSGVVVYLSWLDDEASLAPANISSWSAIVTKVWVERGDGVSR